MDKINKKIPKDVFNTFGGILLTKQAEKVANIVPKKENTMAGKTLINLFLKWIYITKIDIKTNENTFKSCACFCVIDNSKDKRGIKRVPPPIPIPPKIPPKKPDNIYKKIVILFPFKQ